MLIELAGRQVCAGTGGRPFAPDLPCHVFVHGAQNDHCVWARVAHGMADAGHAVLAPDLPGHGASEGPPLPDIGAMADWLLAFIEKTGAGGSLAKVGAGGTARGRGITLVGHSMGSLVALEAAARAPRLIGRLILVGASLPMPVAPLLLDTARADPAKAMRMIVRWSHSALAARGANMNGGHGLWLPAISLRIMERQDPAVLHNDLAACHAYVDGPAAAARLACPVTLVAGTHDRMTPLRAARACIDQLHAAAPTIAIDRVELAGIGHAIMAEAPDALCAALRAA